MTSAPGSNPSNTSGKIPGAEKKIVAGIFGILLGSLGIHKFYLGYKQEGIIMLAVSVAGILLSCVTLGLSGFAATGMHVIGLIEGILYLSKSDDEFVRTYIDNKRPWF